MSSQEFEVLALGKVTKDVIKIAPKECVKEGNLLYHSGTKYLIKLHDPGRAGARPRSPAR